MDVLLTTPFTILYNLFNPSIADYIIDKYINDWNKLKQIFQALSSYSWLKQLESLWWKFYSKINSCISLDKNLYKEILEYLIEDKKLLKKDNDYFIYLSKLCFLESICNDKVLHILQWFIDTYKEVSLNIIVDVIELISTNLNELIIESSDFLNKHIIGRPLDLKEKDINIIWKFLDKLDSKYNFKYDSDLLYYIKESIENYYIWKIEEESEQIDLSNFIDIENDYCWETNINYDEEKIQDEIIYNIDDNFKQYKSITNMNINLYNIFLETGVNIERLVNNYINNLTKVYDKENFSSNISNLVDYSNDIDELFYRW